MANYNPKRITLFAGHYGSGKTNIAVNFAVMLKNKGLSVKVADLDIVNPYFRTKDSTDELQKQGIELVSPAFANTNVDLPALPQEIYGVVSDVKTYAVMDIGGDDRGAYALGRYTPSILAENNYEMIFVANFFRPLTQTAEDALTVMREIEYACKIPFTAIINNSNLGNITKKEDIETTLEETKKLSELSSLPVIFTSVREDIKGVEKFLGELLPLKLQEKYFDIKEI